MTQLFAIVRDGFSKTITAEMRKRALVVTSHAFDSEGYDRDYEIVVERSDLALLAEALGLRRASGRRIINVLGERFGSLAGDSKFERFLKDNDIPATVGGYTSMP